MINMDKTTTTTTTTQSGVSLDKLTPRQKQVIVLFNQGTPVKAIAKELGVKPVTVYGAIKSANRRLGIVGRLRKSSWKKYKPGKVAVPATPKGLKSYLDNLPARINRAEFKSRKSISIHASIHAHESKTNPALYSLASKVQASISAMAILAEKHGKVFSRRQFILEAIAEKIKGVQS